ncbi:glycosyltransferase [Candidatus Uhrbacteria bacterium]|nr:glycosyltransferase [Candidatus Uhrbacteria bacterium]
MTIILITSLYRPYRRGGAEVVCETIVDELKKKYRVIVITTAAWKGWRSLRARPINEDGITVYRYYPLNIFSFSAIEDHKPFLLRCLWHVFDTFNFHSYLTVRGILKKEKPDIVMTHNLKGIGYLIVSAIRRMRLFHIHTMHDIQLMAPSGVVMIGKDHTWSFRMGAAFFSFFHRAFFGSPAVVIFPSRFLHAFYDRWNFFSRSKKIVLPNPIPSHALFLTSPTDEIQTDRLRAYAAGKRTFLYLGLLKKQKGIFTLLSAFNALQYSSARLLIGGGGHAEERVRILASPDQRITVLGVIDREALKSVFTEAHFVVVPSLLYENSPMVVYESFATSIPVIVSESGGASELVSDGENGFIVPAGDESALLYALERACSLDGKHYTRMSLSARACIADFSAEEYCKKLIL